MQVNKEADFVLKGNKVLHPPVRTDGLELYYDTKGKKNTDTYKNKLLDMSGNDRHGELHNFNYKNLSGYQEDSELVFDGIDDTLKMPKLNGIDVNNFTYQLNNNILAFTGDEVRTVKNGDVEVSGRNYLRNSDLSLGTEFWSGEGSLVDGGLLLEGTPGLSSLVHNLTEVPEGDYTLQVWYEVLEGQAPYLHRDGISDAQAINHYPFEVDKEYFELRVTIRASNLMFAFRYAGDSPADHLVGKTLIKRVKLEEGNVATPWTPAPEDLLETTELKGNILGDMEDIVDDHTRDEQSGVEVFTDKADDSLVKVEIDGKSYQHAGSGKNLHRPEKIIDDNNRISGTSRSLARSRGDIYWHIDYMDIKPNTQYTFSIKPDTEYEDGVFYHVLDEDYEFVLGSGSSSESVGNGHTFTTPLNSKYIRYSFQYGLEDSIQFEEGSTATEYEPPAPTPDYPIEIHSLNDFDVVSSVGRGNLIVSSDVTPDTYIESDGRLRGINGHFVTGFIEVKANEVYTISMLLQRNRYSRVAYYDLDKNFIKRDLFQRQEVTQIKPEQDGFIRWSPDVDGGTYGPGFKIEHGTMPAPEDITENDNHPLIDKISLSLSEPLRSVGDVKDRLFRDSDGLWKVERNVGEQVFMSSSGFVVRQDTATHTVFRGVFLTNVSGDWTSYSTKYKSSHFIIGSASEIHNGESSGMAIDGRTNALVYISIEKGSILKTDDMTGFNSWLSSNPVTILYQYATPTTETLDQEIQDKLNNLRSFQDSNYVYTIINNKTDISPSHISENLKPTIHTEFLAKDHYKENRTVNNLLIWNRSLEDEELLSQNKLFHERFNMKSNTIKGEPIHQEINLLNGGYVGNTLSLDYMLEI